MGCPEGGGKAGLPSVITEYNRILIAGMRLAKPFYHPPLLATLTGTQLPKGGQDAWGNAA